MHKLWPDTEWGDRHDQVHRLRRLSLGVSESERFAFEHAVREVFEVETGVYPTASLQVVPSQCMHCEDAPCQAVCPTGATYTNEDGIVCIDHGRCIGCKYCMAACPYQARVVDERTGAVDKCRFCTVSALNGTEMSTCVTACPADVRVFGDLDDPDLEVSKVLAATHATPLLGDATKSKIFYVR